MFRTEKNLRNTEVLVWEGIWCHIWTSSHGKQRMAAISLTREVTCKKKTHKHVLGWLVWQQRAEWTCEKRNWRQRVCGQIRGDQSLRQKGKEAECGLSWGTSIAISILECTQKVGMIVRIPEKKKTGRILFAFLRHRKCKQHDGSL